MKQCTWIAASCGMAMTTLAFAGPPASLDRVPDDAAITVVIPNVQGFIDDMKNFGESVIPADQQLQMNMGLAMVQTFIDMPGMNGAGSAAAVVYMSEDTGPDSPPMVMLLPVSDFGQLREGVGALGSGPVYEANMGGNNVYLKDVGGGFAAVSPMPELVQEFKGDGGHVNGHMRRVGPSGEQVLEGNDITMIANLEILSPFIRQGATQMKDQMGMMMMMMGPQAQQAGPMLEMVTGLMDSLAEDGQAGLFGIQMSPEGVSFDTGLQFKEGSASAKRLASKGNTADMLNKLPSSEFLFAYAFDTGNPGISSILAELGQAAAAAEGAPGGINYLEMMKNATGVAGAMGSVPMMGAGIFSNMVTVTMTKDGAGVVETMKGALNAMNGQSAQGMKYSTTFDAGSTSISGVDVASYALSMQPDGSGDGGAVGAAQMVMPMLFGPNGGPNGYIASVDGVVVQTLSQNTPLMEKAINAARNGGGLGTNESVKTVAGRLPDSRIMEFYLSIDQVMNTVGPMAAMFGALPGFDRMDAMPPIGVGASIGDGGLVNRIHVPSQVMEWMVEFSQTMQADSFDGEEGVRF